MTHEEERGQQCRRLFGRLDAKVVEVVCQSHVAVESAERRLSVDAYRVAVKEARPVAPAPSKNSLCNEVRP